MRVEVRDLAVSYGGRNVLRGVSFAAGPAEIVGIIGPNGAGKSTLLKTLIGLIPSDGGDVLIDGRPPGRRRHDVAYLPQRSDIDWNYPAVAGEVVAMGRYPHLRRLRRRTAHDRGRVSDAMERLRLTDLADRPISELSGGQQQRMMLARALAQEARLLLLDEPFAGIDVVTEKMLHNELREVRNEGATVVVVNHDLTAVSSLYDKLLVVSGEMIAYGPLQEVFTTETVAAAYGVSADSAWLGTQPR